MSQFAISSFGVSFLVHYCEGSTVLYEPIVYLSAEPIVENKSYSILLHISKADPVGTLLVEKNIGMLLETQIITNTHTAK
jgi:hypothetical protein